MMNATPVRLGKHKAMVIVAVGCLLAALSVGLVYMAQPARAVCDPSPCTPDPSDNTEPTVTVDSPSVTVNEGQTATNSGTYDDLDQNSVSLSASPLGSITSKTGTFTGNWTWQFATNDNLSQRAITITGNDGVRDGTAQFNLTVNNVAPSLAGISAPSSMSEGSPIPLILFGFSDPSSVDAASLQFRFDCGDGLGYNFSGASSRICSTTDNGIRTVKGQVQDKDLAQSPERTTTVTVTNVSPTADLSGPNSVDEGVSEAFTFINQFDPSSADTNARFHYAFDCDGRSLDAATYANSSADSTFRCSYGDGPVTSTLRARIIDKDGGFTERTKQITVNNVGPQTTLAANNPLNVDEGSTHTYQFSMTEEGDDTLQSVDAKCGENGVELNQTLNSVTCRFDDGVKSSVISVTATDDDGKAGNTATQTVNIANVGPQSTLSANNGQTVNESSAESRTFNFSVDDPGDDTVSTPATGCGDNGVKVVGSDSFDAQSNTGSFQCRFDDGSKNSEVTVSATDDDGTTGNTATQTVQIDNVLPTASGLNAPASVSTGSPSFTISLANPTDASDADKGSLQYAFDCGDGNGYSAFSSSNTFSCSTSPLGTRTVGGKIRDKDGGETVPFTKTVNVLPLLLSITDVRVTEGDTGSKSAVFTVRLSAASSKSVTVNYRTANGTAKAPADYATKISSLSFLPGQTTKRITVAVKGDRLNERNETFFVNLSGATNANLGDGSGKGTIIDND